MRYAIVENGVIVNVIIAEDPPENGVASETANIGDAYQDASLSDTLPADAQ